MTNAELIAEARRVVLDHKAVASFRLIDQLADALEASEAQVARLLHASHGKWPDDLLEAVRHFAVIHRQGTGHPRSECEQARATLVCYGLIEERPNGD